MNTTQNKKDRINYLNTWIESKQKAVNFLKDETMRVCEFSESHNMVVDGVSALTGVIRLMISDLNSDIYIHKKELDRLKEEV